MARSLPDLVRLFDTIVAPNTDAGGRFTAQPVSGYSSCAIGKDSAGSPVLLVEIDAAEPRSAAAPVLLECLSVLHNIDCRLQLQDDEPVTRRLSVIRCTASERVFHEYFLRALAPIVLSLPQRPTRQHLVAAVNTLVNLFSKLSQAPRKTVQGLWAELFVISRSRDPSHLMRCWHSLPQDRFDFADDSQRVEVKTASGRVRSHRFSLEQLRPPGGSVAIIISMLIEHAGAGETILDLLDTIRSAIDDPELMLRLDGTVAQTLGTEWRQAMTVAFDSQLAEESLAFYDVRDIPSFPVSLPPEISDVHFRVDLTNQKKQTIDQLEAYTGLLNSACLLGRSYFL